MKHASRFWLTALAVAALCGAACGMGESRQKAEAAVGTFHDQLNAARFDEIYAGATPAFQQSGPKSAFVEYVGAVRRKLGSFKTGAVTFWRINTTTAGTFIDLSYESHFEQDTAAEEFTFRMTDGRPVLQHYNINSRVLVTR